MKLLKTAIVVGLLGLFLGAMLPAHMATGQEQYFVRGYVRDEIGAPIAGAIVNIKDLRTSDYKQTTTDGNGYYQSDIGDMPNGIQTGDFLKLTCSKMGKKTVDRIAPLDLGIPFMERWFKLYGVANFWYNYKIYDLDENKHSSADSKASINVGTAGTEVHPDYNVCQHAYLYAEWSISEKNNYNKGQLHTVISFYFEIYDAANPNYKIAGIPVSSYTDDLIPGTGIDRNGEIGVTIVPDPRQNDPDGHIYYIPSGHTIITKAYISCSWVHYIVAGNNVGWIDDSDNWKLDASDSWIKVTWMNYP
jgi:hypothetical protein